MTVDELQVVITANTASLKTAMTGVNSAMDKVQQQAKKAGDSMGKSFENAGAKMKSVGNKLVLGVTTPIIGLGVAAAKLASDFNESLNKIDVAFGKDAQGVKTWANTTLKSFGIANGTALDMASNYGDMATSMGLPTGAAATMSEKLVGLAGDLASFKNIGIDEANTALTSIFTGETESLKSLGIVMTQANLQDYAASKGIKTKIADMTQAELTQLRYNFVLSKTNNAQGDFERTGAGTANSARVFKESLKELGAVMGQNILPVITPIIQKLSEMVQNFGKLSPSMQQTIIKILAIIAIGGPVLVVIGTLVTAVGAIVSVFSAAGAAIASAGGIIAVLTGPIGIAIAIIIVIVGIGYELIRNWGAIKAGAIALGTAISTAWANIKTAIVAKWYDIKIATIAAWDNIKTSISSKIEAIKSSVSGKIEAIKTLFRNMFSGGITLPHISLPHFNMSGSFSLNPPSIPSIGVSWYDKGGIFNSPSIIGVGEKRPEFVGALDDLRKIVREESGNDLNVTITNFINNRPRDVQSFAEELQFYMRQKQTGGSK